MPKTSSIITFSALLMSYHPAPFICRKFKAGISFSQTRVLRNETSVFLSIPSSRCTHGFSSPAITLSCCRNSGIAIVHNFLRPLLSFHHLLCGDHSIGGISRESRGAQGGLDTERAVSGVSNIRGHSMHRDQEL